MRQPKMMLANVGAFGSSYDYPIDNPLLDEAQAQRMMQRLLADKINAYADIDELRILIISGAQPDGVVTQGLTPLHYACHRDYYTAAKLLLVRGAKVNALDDAGYSPLHLCAEKGNYRLMKLLLQYSAKVCYCNDDKSSVARAAEFPLRDCVDEPLRIAIRGGHYECARLLLESGADANARYFDGPEITHVSPIDVHFLRLLLSHGADPNVYARDGLTPLMRAARHKAKGVKSAQVLLDFGAQINAFAAPKKDARTALHYALFSAHLPMVEFLLKNGAAAEMPPDYDHPSPLDIAILRDDVRAVELLLRFGADVNRFHGRYGAALHTALFCTKRRDADTVMDDTEYGNEHDSGGEKFATIETLLRLGANPNLSALDASLICAAARNSRSGDLASSAGDENISAAEFSRVKSPMAEFLRCFGDQLPDERVLSLLLSYGGRILLCSRAQVRNFTVLIERMPQIADLILPFSEIFGNIREFLTNSAQNGTQIIAAFLRTPRCLSDFCRLRIRECLRNGSDGMSPTTVDTLPIPNAQKCFVLGRFL